MKITRLNILKKLGGIQKQANKNLENLLNHIKANSVNVIKTEDYEYGKFAWVRDLDGNRIELYQPL